MKTMKNKTAGNSDTEKVLARAAEMSPKQAKGKAEKPGQVSPDTITAEKDEVKNAEERMRQIQKNK